MADHAEPPVSEPKLGLSCLGYIVWALLIVGVATTIGYGSVLGVALVAMGGDLNRLATTVGEQSILSFFGGLVALVLALLLRALFARRMVSTHRPTVEKLEEFSDWNEHAKATGPRQLWVGIVMVILGALNIVLVRFSGVPFTTENSGMVIIAGIFGIPNIIFGAIRLRVNRHRR